MIRRRKPKVYISAPITGYDLNERRKMFAQWAQMLVDAGCEPVNPMEKGLPDSAPYKEHMKADIANLLKCDGYILHKSWPESRGCKCEESVAAACGIKFIGFIGENGIEFISENLRNLKAEVRKR